MLYSEIITVCSQIHTKHINTLYGQNKELVNVKLVVYDMMIYLLTAIGCHPVAAHIYTQTIHRTIQNKQYTEQHNNFGRVRAVPRLG